MVGREDHQINNSTIGLRYHILHPELLYWRFWRLKQHVSTVFLLVRTRLRTLRKLTLTIWRNDLIYWLAKQEQRWLSPGSPCASHPQRPYISKSVLCQICKRAAISGMGKQALEEERQPFTDLSPDHGRPFRWTSAMFNLSMQINFSSHPLSTSTTYHISAKHKS